VLAGAVAVGGLAGVALDQEQRRHALVLQPSGVDEIGKVGEGVGMRIEERRVSKRLARLVRRRAETVRDLLREVVVTRPAPSVRSGVSD
jgi:hypothetical protein